MNIISYQSALSIKVLGEHFSWPNNHRFISLITTNNYTLLKRLSSYSNKTNKRRIQCVCVFLFVFSSKSQQSNQYCHVFVTCCCILFLLCLVLEFKTLLRLCSLTSTCAFKQYILNNCHAFVDVLCMPLHACTIFLQKNSVCLCNKFWKLSKIPHANNIVPVQTIVRPKCIYKKCYHEVENNASKYRQ